MKSFHFLIHGRPCSSCHSVTSGIYLPVVYGEKPDSRLPPAIRSFLISGSGPSHLVLSFGLIHLLPNLSRSNLQSQGDLPTRCSGPARQATPFFVLCLHPATDNIPQQGGSGGCDWPAWAGRGHERDERLMFRAADRVRPA